MMLEWVTLPTKSFRALLLLKLWWPLWGEEGADGRIRLRLSAPVRTACRAAEPPGARQADLPPKTIAAASRASAHQSWPTTKSAQNMVPCAAQ